MKNAHEGFSLLELLVVIAIIALLSMLAVPNFMRFLAKAKRTEAYTQLRVLSMLEKTYFAEHGTYTTNIMGPDSLGWKTDGQTCYTYGFSQGTEGKNYVTGSLKTPASALGTTSADAKGFVIAAAGDIDNDGEHDILTISDQSNDIKIVKDDLA